MTFIFKAQQPLATSHQSTVPTPIESIHLLSHQHTTRSMKVTISTIPFLPAAHYSTFLEQISFHGDFLSLLCCLEIQQVCQLAHLLQVSGPFDPIFRPSHPPLLARSDRAHLLDAVASEALAFPSGCLVCVTKHHLIQNQASEAQDSTHRSCCISSNIVRYLATCSTNRQIRKCTRMSWYVLPLSEPVGEITCRGGESTPQWVLTCSCLQVQKVHRGGCGTHH